MPINQKEILEAVKHLAKNADLQVCFAESAKGAAAAGMGAFVGGVLMGPVGLVLGGAVGGLAGSQMCQQYKPLYQVLEEMNDKDKERLVKHVNKILDKISVTDFVLLMAIVKNAKSAERDLLVKELGNFFGGFAKVAN